MSQINVSNTDKERFDELQGEDQTQKEFFSDVLDAYENRDDKVVIDTEEIIEELRTGVASEIELAAYRGVKEAIEEIEI
jgi:hypothetical protein